MAEAFKLLVVESHSRGLHNLVSILSAENREFTTAVTGEDALRQVFLQDFDLILYSLNIPHMDALSFVTKIRNRESSRITPILLLATGDEEESRIGRAYSAGKVDHLSFPLSPVLLKAKAEMWLALSKDLQSVGISEDAAKKTLVPGGDGAVFNQEDRFRKAIEGAQDTAVLWLDDNGIIVNSNSVVRRILGFTEQELKGKPISLVFTPEDRKAGLQDTEMRTAREHEQALDERWHLRKDGSRFWAIGLMTPLWKAPGQLDGYIKILRDRTDQKLAFDLALDTEKRYKELLDSTTEGIFGIDLKGQCTFANAACLRQLGYPDESALLGKNLHDILSHVNKDGTRRQGVGCPFISETGEVMTPKGEDSILMADGSVFPAEFRIHAIRTNDIVLGAVVTFLDISERKKSETRFREVEQRAMHAQRLEAIGRLAGGVAHELNNSLTGILGNCHLLLEGLGTDSPVRPGLEWILMGGEKAADVVRKLLVFAGKENFALKPISLEAFLKERFPRFKAVTGDKVELSIDLAPDLPAVYSDPEQLEKTILKILANAREAMSVEEDKISLSARRIDLMEPMEAERLFVRPGIYVCLSIRNPGRGIPEEIQERIFEPFFSTKGMGKVSVGLGLSSAYGFIAQCGGTIHVESEAAHGAAIEIYLRTTLNEKD